MTGGRGGGDKEGWRPKGRRYTGRGREGSVVGAAVGLFRLGGSRWRNDGRRGGRDLRGGRRSGGGGRGLNVGEILGAGLRVVESGGVLEDAAGVFGDGLYAGGIGQPRILGPAVLAPHALSPVPPQLFHHPPHKH